MQNTILQLQAIDPPDPDELMSAPGEVYFYIGYALYQLDRSTEALAAWETCREKSPKFALVHNNLALIYMRLGRLEQARESIERAQELGFPVHPQFKADLERAILEGRAGEAG